MTTIQETLIKEGLQFITALDEHAEIYTQTELRDYLESKAEEINSGEFVDLEVVLASVEKQWSEFDRQLDELHSLTLKQDEGIPLSDSESKRYMELVESLKDNDIIIPFGIEY